MRAAALTRMRPRPASDYIEQLMAMSDEKRPYLGVVLPSLLMNAPTASPVSVQEADIRLDLPVWQETLAQAKRIAEEGGGSEEDFFAAMDLNTCIQGGAAVLAGAAVDPGYSLRVIEDGGSTARLLPIPN